MNDLIEAMADLLRGGIVIEKDGENAVRIRLDEKPESATEEEQAAPVRRSW